MRVLFLGPADSPVLAYLRSVEDRVFRTSRPLLRIDPRVRRADFVVSHRYLHRVRPWALERFAGRVVNLHNSLLPYNRGWDPVIWSVVEGTPSGVTIHHMDEDLDTGEVIAQREVPLARELSVTEAWRTLHEELARLFREHWPEIRKGDCPATPQPSGGSYHSRADRAAAVQLLPRGWETTLGELEDVIRG
jgi:methionyl-tRNA formyltransferase